MLSLAWLYPSRGFAGQLTWKLLTAITLVPLGALAIFFTVAYVLPRL